MNLILDVVSSSSNTVPYPLRWDAKTQRILSERNLDSEPRFPYYYVCDLGHKDAAHEQGPFLPLGREEAKMR